MKYRVCLLVFIAVLGCNNSIDVSYVKSSTWSYNGGFKVGNGDFIVFDESNLFEIHGDTIYYSHLAKAIIKNINKREFKMELTSLDGKEKSEYRNVEESFK